MSDGNYMNDAPIHKPEDDNFGVTPFAQNLAKSIREIKTPIGVTLALNGAWGSGKSSAVNLIRHHLKSDEEKGDIEVIDFKCWWFRGEEALTLAFLQELNSSLEKSLGDEAKEFLPKISKRLLQTSSPLLETVAGLLTGKPGEAATKGVLSSINQFFPDDSIEHLFTQLSEALEKQNKRYLVIIDDIDRLTPDEALAMFRLVKSVGRLPNVIYLLVFDRELAEKAVTEKYPSEGAHFLEKIIQAGFEVPLPLRDDLNRAIFAQINLLPDTEELDREQHLRFMNVYYDCVAPYLNTPRDLARLTNSMSISWAAVKNEVNLADFLALEALKLFEPSLYNALRSSKDRICGVGNNFGNTDNSQEVKKALVELTKEKHHSQIEGVLDRLFPRLENMGYGSDFLQGWEAARRVCTEKHFDTYFRLHLGDEVLSVGEVKALAAKCGNSSFIKSSFREALLNIRSNGKSKVPLLLEELNVYSDDIKAEDIPVFISTVFEIADELLREEDKEQGMLSMGDNFLRIHWLIRKLTTRRFSLEERSSIFIEACKNAQPVWLIDFASSMVGDYSPKDDKEPRSQRDLLLTEDHAMQLKSEVLEKIKALADNGELIDSPRLSYVLYRWRDFTEDDDEVKAWVAENIQSDEKISKLANAFTSESWSQNMSDVVSIMKVRASISGLEHILDVEHFRKRLEEVESRGDVLEVVKQPIETFLNAWKEQEKDRYS